MKVIDYIKKMQLTDRSKMIFSIHSHNEALLMEYMNSVSVVSASTEGYMIARSAHLNAGESYIPYVAAEFAMRVGITYLLPSYRFGCCCPSR